jgi:hypothetical protein
VVTVLKVDQIIMAKQAGGPSLARVMATMIDGGFGSRSGCAAAAAAASGVVLIVV